MPITRITTASDIYLYVLQAIYVQASLLNSAMVISTFLHVKTKSILLD